MFDLWEGQTFVLPFKVNPSTGYSWFMKPIESECVETVQEASFESSNKKFVGAPGTKKFVFKAIDSGCEQEVELEYMARGRVTERKTVKLVVGGQPKEVYDDNVVLIDLKDLKKDADGVYSYSLPMDK